MLLPRIRWQLRTTRVYSPSSIPGLTARHISTRSKLFQVAEEVEEALQTGKPVVALETTIYTHGFPYPENVALASHLESLVRVHGGVPATIGILNGTARVGMSPEQLIELISTAGSKDTWKISRRDLGLIGGLGLRGRKLHGGTTISGTIILAHLAGIKVFATGGLGGVHRGGENSMDISADLTELGRTPVAVVSSGCKSFLDIPRTLEYLETQGVGVATFADGRSGSVDFPAFFSRDSGVKSPQTLESEADAAAVIHAQFQLPVHSGLLFANPVPAAVGMTKAEIDSIIAQAVTEAEQKGISGSANTPYILKRIRELSNGGSVAANRALIEANIIRGTKVAVELAKLERADKEGAWAPNSGLPEHSKADPKHATVSSAYPDVGKTPKVRPAKVDILIAGSVACDSSCDYSPFAKADYASPVLQTSNPAQISQSIGGVGRNVALAAHLSGAHVALASVVADDIVGRVVLDEVAKSGIDTSTIRVLPTTSGARTAQYIAVNDTAKDLVVAMGDFTIFDRTELGSQQYWADVLSGVQPKWLVMDGNWSADNAAAILSAAKSQGVPVAFEPVSTAKAARVLGCVNHMDTLPNHRVHLASPNILELTAMHQAAEARGLFESDTWWQVVDSFGMSSAGSRDKFVAATSQDLVDTGLPQQVVRLLPFCPTIVTKLGKRGCLLTQVLGRGDPRLRDLESAPYILSRSGYENSPVGGLYMRLFPPAAVVDQEDVVSVNGVGDTLLGALMAGITASLRAGQTPRLENLLPLAQQAAVLTLKSSASVSGEVAVVKSEIAKLLSP